MGVWGQVPGAHTLCAVENSTGRFFKISRFVTIQSPKYTITSLLLIAKSNRRSLPGCRGPRYQQPLSFQETFQRARSSTRENLFHFSFAAMRHSRGTC